MKTTGIDITAEIAAEEAAGRKAFAEGLSTAFLPWKATWQGASTGEGEMRDAWLRGWKAEETDAQPHAVELAISYQGRFAGWQDFGPFDNRAEAWAFIQEKGMTADQEGDRFQLYPAGQDDFEESGSLVWGQSVGHALG